MTAEQIKAGAEASADIALALNRVADAGAQLMRSGLKRDAMLALLSRYSGVGIRDVAAVLDAIPQLRQYTVTAKLKT